MYEARAKQVREAVAASDAITKDVTAILTTFNQRLGKLEKAVRPVQARAHACGAPLHSAARCERVPLPRRRRRRSARR